MAIKKSMFILAFLITLSLLCVILILSNVLNNDRKSALDTQMSTITNVNELQMYSLMTDVYGDKMACLAFKQGLHNWDQSLWSLGNKIEAYRLATEQFQTDPFYISMKKQFNDNEILYLMFLKKVDSDCSLHQDIISFFYKNAEECPKCDDQSFILTDIKQKFGDNVSVFSFDMDLNISDVNILNDYYGIKEYPCIVVNEQRYCGIQDMEFITGKLCSVSGNCTYKYTARNLTEMLNLTQVNESSAASPAGNYSEPTNQSGNTVVGIIFYNNSSTQMS